MYILFVVLVVLAAVLMVLVVLVQNSKGGGLASSFASSNQIMGVRKTTDVLEKTTWSLAVIMVVLSIVSAYTLTGSSSASTSVMQQDAATQRAINPNNMQAFPAAQENTEAATTETAPAEETPAAAPAEEEKN
ncbi:MAG: preprotein translocase subunit SecG [Bacteroidaceae bacterium]|nr:preprotein translocase subunit SecG [Bacteroidaceae bacterium]